MKKILSIALILVLALSAAALAETPAYQETVVSIDAGDHQIPATICVPTEGENFPAVVMLHGTASNRDEAGGGYKIAAPILAEKYGVATIRIDFMGNGDWSGIRSVNKFYLIGGVLGIVITVTVMLGVKALSPTLAISVILISQLTVAALIDAFGIMDTEKVAFGWNKLVGTALMISGVLLFKLK